MSIEIVNRKVSILAEIKGFRYFDISRALFSREAGGLKVASDVKLNAPWQERRWNETPFAWKVIKKGRVIE